MNQAYDDNSKQFLEAIKKAMSSMTHSQKKVADYIFKNPMQAAFSTVDEIARTAKVSTTTVVRLALTLNYSGFVDLQKELQAYLNTISRPSVRLEMNLINVEKRNNIIADIAQQQMENISKTYANLSDESIMRAVEKLTSARHIYIFGQRSCYGVCHYMAYNINRTLANCDFIYNNSSDYIESLRRIDSRDVVITMSMPRYVKNVFRFTELAHKRGAFIISISDGYSSPLVPLSDIFFSAEVASKGFHNAMTSTLFIAEVLIGFLVTKNWKRAKENLTDTEGISKAMEQNLF
ncbi:MAG: MurR/RpiR family transcriptional regulator [Treponema sp.]|nr:MurR/RpiR family transcriptional regulator [Treponema sp.]